MPLFTVKSMLKMIIDNDLQMDSVISFCLSEETNEIGSSHYEVDVAAIELSTIKGHEQKTLTVIFDLNDVSQGDE